LFAEKNKLVGEATEKADAKREEFWRIENRINKTKSEIDYRKLKAQSAEVEIQSIEEKLDNLRIEWHTENIKTFELEQDETCPTCGQALPQEQLQEARDRAWAQFNAVKAQKLESINAEGKRLAKRKAELEEELKGISQELDTLTAKLPEIEREKAALQKEIQAIQDGLKQIKPSEEYLRLEAQCKELEEQIQQAQDNTSAAAASIQKEIDTISDAIRALEQAATKVEALKNGAKRIEELKAEERKLAAEYEELEKQIYLTEEFIRTKVELLEGKINSKFRMARFKLFNTLVNGGIEETAETMYNGVPYSNLNNGARLNIGLDIINTLSEHFAFAPVVFIDNAESVVNILPTKGQQIRLIVSGMDKKLRIELAERESLKEVV
jgi:DNA repair exonuclease SbcCD ATPase subunit